MKTVTLPIEEYEGLVNAEALIVRKHASKEKELDKLSQSLKSIERDLKKCAEEKIVVRYYTTDSVVTLTSLDATFELEGLVKQIKNPEVRTLHGEMLKSVKTKSLEISRLKSSNQLLKRTVTALSALLVIGFFCAWVF